MPTRDVVHQASLWITVIRQYVEHIPSDCALTYWLDSYYFFWREIGLYFSPKYLFFAYEMQQPVCEVSSLP